MSSAPSESLNAQIIAVEARILRHRIRITRDARQVQQTIRRRAASGEAVFTAVCLGFALGRKSDRGHWSVLSVISAINTSAALAAALWPSTRTQHGESAPPAPV